MLRVLVADNEISTPRILLLEDEELIAEQLRASLEEMGYSVIAVSQAEDAILYAEQSPPDIVLVDICLKGKIDGIEAAHQLKKRFEVPVVFLTGSADRETFHRAKITGPFGYILKPCDPREVEICIEIAIYKHRAEQEREKLIVELRQALANVKVLRGLLPICAYCKKVRDDSGYWTQVEEYVTRHTEATFNHGMCPCCFDRVKAELDSLEREQLQSAPILAGH